ncbi:hypothetical protein BT96DRAFT_826785 [Gymnopus androsaceus JB14]|uniref:CxC2-like cysteine cluster KDZ transposase-associated domain-containing protein n=1 Tax=Gymnopus androsaceus JB14 TaxID=1447944 RepID=A0A6A4HB88_9AGAR|nr:hypothetical protein BT96DRAFT_826785 [Gymnopus androsaceus JB14]
MVELLPDLTRYFVNHAHNARAASLCSCGRGKCIVSCQDCSFYEAACGECFIDSHRCMPFHWARVWDEQRGFFVRSDISVLREGYAIQLGHHNGICPNSLPPMKFVVTHSNGVHGMRISFCDCFGSNSRIEQLMKGKLFPGSSTDPISAFTFTVLKQYDLHSLQANISAYDYCFTLRRLTDNIFTHLVNDPYQSFMRIARVFRFLKAKLRLGQTHGIDEHFPHRPPGSLVVYCPQCPRPGENMGGPWWHTPRWLRHLKQLRATYDGNHQTNQFFKNTDPFDKSLFGGLSYFPEATEYLKFLESLGAISPEEYAAHCNHVKVIANQGRIQNQNCAKSGVVNTQCDHVFVMATADMPNGESRYAVVDASNHHAFKLQGFGDGKTDNHHDEICFADSYDAMCSYYVYRGERFATSTYLEDQKEFVLKFEHGIPDLHIKGHKDDCMVIFGCPYHWCVAHFHCETAEYYWVELNQVGAYTRQMNDGHRKDTIIAHHNDWNWRKTVNSAHHLSEALRYARLQMQTKGEFFKQLSQSTPREQVSAWSRLSREPKEEKDSSGKKYFTSVYHRRPQAAPDLKALLEHLAAKDEASAKLGANPSSVEVFFRKAFDNPDAMSVHDIEELRGRNIRLQKALRELRTRRAEIMPRISPLISRAVEKPDSPENEKLFLPSDLTLEERVQYGVSALAREEITLRQAQAEEEVSKVKTIAKSITTMLQFRSKSIRGQGPKTRSEHDVANTFVKRDCHIVGYNYARKALICLGVFDPNDTHCPYPELKPEHTLRLNIDVKRRTGDSKQREGLLWTVGAASDLLTGIEPGDDLPVGLDENLVPIPLITPTKMTQCSSEYRKDSWLWTKGTRNMSLAELQAWELEGDRVQWFRAEAELYRWMEQFELKHAEFERTIWFFRTMGRVWDAMAQKALTPGSTAYAKHHSAIFTDLANNAEKSYKKIAHPDFIDLADGQILADAVAQWREKWLAWMTLLVCTPTVQGVSHVINQSLVNAGYSSRIFGELSWSIMTCKLLIE